MNTSRSGFFLFIFLFLFLNSQASDEASIPGNNRSISHYATREGRIINLHPSGATFQIPQDWIDWDARSHDNLRLTQVDILNTKEPKTTWDSSYAEIVDAALPLGQCVAHLGSDGWGSRGASWTGLQMRVYALDQKTSAIQQQILKSGSKMVESISPGAMTWSDKVNGWQRVSIQYSNSSGQSDFSAIVRIDFYVRRLETETVVLVFMHARGYEDDTIKTILDSFSIKS